jgi:hypothetical protein
VTRISLTDSSLGLCDGDPPPPLSRCVVGSGRFNVLVTMDMVDG